MEDPGVIFLNTGNILKMNGVIKDNFHNPMTELKETLIYLVKHFMLDFDDKEVKTCAININPPPTLTTDVNKECCHNIKCQRNVVINVKLFLYEWNADYITEATNLIIEKLLIDHVNSLAIAFPDYCIHKTKVEQFVKMWPNAEQLFSDGKTLSLGVCDLNKNQLEELCSSVEIKPHSLQINSILCCLIPEDLDEFASFNSIKLYTHSDKYKILATEEFKEILKPVLEKSNSNLNGKTRSDVKVDWVMRYIVTDKDRSIIASKGYLIKLKSFETSSCCLKTSNHSIS